MAKNLRPCQFNQKKISSSVLELKNWIQPLLLLLIDCVALDKSLYFLGEFFSVYLGERVALDNRNV